METIHFFPMKVRSMVGLIPMFAVEAVDQDTLDKYLTSEFKARYHWLLHNRRDLTEHDNISLLKTKSHLMPDGVSFALVNQEKLRCILKRMLDETDFLSPYGIRALSKVHASPPYQLPFPIKTQDGAVMQPGVEYEPAESRLGLFESNSN